jgi:hypothetical protein
MEIRIEQGQVVIELSPSEFAAFEAMFINLQSGHSVKILGEEWPEHSLYGGPYLQSIVPFHLCRTIGEACAVEQAGPLDILSLYPFWKYGFCFSDNDLLDFNFTEIDPHKKATLADELGMGFCVWAMEEIFKCEAWCDTADAIAKHQVEALGTSRPDFVCTFPDGTFGIFEAKGTTQGYGTSNSQAETGKKQTAQIVPKNGVVSVRCCCATTIMQENASKRTRLLLLDPPSTPLGDRPSNRNRSSGSVGEVPPCPPVKVDLTADAIIRASKARRYREKMFGDIRTLFVSDAGEFSLVRTPYIEEKRHGWLDIK